MKILGHPLHLMLIHFPSALFPMELVCYALFYYTNNISYAYASFYAMTGGAAIGWLAVITGSIDVLRISPEQPAVINKALLHGLINVTVVITYSILAYSVYKKLPDLPAASMPVLILKIIVVSFMIIGNFLGGSLVLRDRVGAEK